MGVGVVLFITESRQTNAAIGLVTEANWAIRLKNVCVCVCRVCACVSVCVCQ